MYISYLNLSSVRRVKKPILKLNYIKDIQYKEKHDWRSGLKPTQKRGFQIKIGSTLSLRKFQY